MMFTMADRNYCSLARDLIISDNILSLCVTRSGLGSDQIVQCMYLSCTLILIAAEAPMTSPMTCEIPL